MNSSEYNDFLKKNDIKQTSILGDFIETRKVAAYGRRDQTYWLCLNPGEVLGEIFFPNISETEIISIEIVVGGSILESICTLNTPFNINQLHMLREIREIENNIIPFSFTKYGLPNLEYEEIKIYIRMKKYTNSHLLYNIYKDIDPSFCPPENKKKMLHTYFKTISGINANYLIYQIVTKKHINLQYLVQNFNEKNEMKLVKITKNYKVYQFKDKKYGEAFCSYKPVYTSSGPEKDLLNKYLIDDISNIVNLYIERYENLDFFTIWLLPINYCNGYLHWIFG